MIDYLNPHHIYPDTQAAPDLGMGVKRDEKETNKMADTHTRPKNAGLISSGMKAARNEPPETDAEHIIWLYRQGVKHADIARRGFDLAEVRRVISEATAADETLYPMHRRMGM